MLGQYSSITLLFPSYLIPFGSISKKNNFYCHCFGDDVQIYLPLKTNPRVSIQILIDCVWDIKSCFSLSSIRKQPWCTI